MQHNTLQCVMSAIIPSTFSFRFHLLKMKFFTSKFVSAFRYINLSEPTSNIPNVNKEKKEQALTGQLLMNIYIYI